MQALDVWSFMFSLITWYVIFSAAIIAGMGGRILIHRYRDPDSTVSDSQLPTI